TELAAEELESDAMTQLGMARFEHHRHAAFGDLPVHDVFSERLAQRCARGSGRSHAGFGGYQNQREATKSRTSVAVLAQAARCTMADPTTTPSACGASAATCSFDWIPNPTTSGSVVRERTSSSRAARSGGSVRRTPVVPVTET